MDTRPTTIEATMATVPIITTAAVPTNTEVPKLQPLEPRQTMVDVIQPETIGVEETATTALLKVIVVVVMTKTVIVAVEIEAVAVTITVDMVTTVTVRTMVAV